jgi:hypothetical protein
MRRVMASLLVGFRRLVLFEGTGYRTGMRGSNDGRSLGDRY